MMDNFCYADIHYLSVKYDLVFFSFAESLLEQAFLKFAVSEIDSKNI